MKASKIGFSGTYYGEFTSPEKAKRFRELLVEEAAESRQPLKTFIRQYGPISKLKVETPAKQNSPKDKNLIAWAVHNYTSTANLLGLSNKTVKEYFKKFTETTL